MNNVEIRETRCRRVFSVSLKNEFSAAEVAEKYNSLIDEFKTDPKVLNLSGRLNYGKDISLEKILEISNELSIPELSVTGPSEICDEKEIKVVISYDPA